MTTNLETDFVLNTEPLINLMTELFDGSMDHSDIDSELKNQKPLNIGVFIDCFYDCYYCNAGIVKLKNILETLQTQVGNQYYRDNIAVAIAATLFDEQLDNIPWNIINFLDLKTEMDNFLHEIKQTSLEFQNIV